MRVKQCVKALAITIDMTQLPQNAKLELMTRTNKSTERRIICMRVFCIALMLVILGLSLARYI